MSAENREKFDRDLTRPPVGQVVDSGAWSREAEMAAFEVVTAGR